MSLLSLLQHDHLVEVCQWLGPVDHLCLADVSRGAAVAWVLILRYRAEVEGAPRSRHERRVDRKKIKGYWLESFKVRSKERPWLSRSLCFLAYLSYNRS